MMSALEDADARVRAESLGDGGTLMIKWWDGNRYRVAIAYVGEDGIEANTAYRLDDQQQFFAVPVPQQKTSKR
jgi:hypothetical protein